MLGGGEAESTSMRIMYAAFTRTNRAISYGTSNHFSRLRRVLLVCNLSTVKKVDAASTRAEYSLDVAAENHF